MSTEIVHLADPSYFCEHGTGWSKTSSRIIQLVYMANTNVDQAHISV